MLVGHSTGGLIASLWAASHPDRVTALVLNSPWLDLQGSAMVRALGTPVIDAVGHSMPTSVLRLPDSGFYARVLHTSLEGEWEYDLDDEVHAVAADPGRLAAGHPDRAAAGRGRAESAVPGPGDVLPPRPISAGGGARRCGPPTPCWTSSRSCSRATRLGRLVTIVRVDQGLHDVWLSAPAVRKQALDEMMHWIDAYVLDAPPECWYRAQAVARRLTRGLTAPKTTLLR